ncbi:alpha/beta hydrolase [Nocardioides sp. NPDC057767]|uniref:alpha/beta hydrolase n=1 Tax=unclassified Nocardioides TaxID=2615069 RepID=UPI00367204FF
MTRQDITFTSGDVRCAGWFYPAGPDPRPAVVMAHGLAGIKEMRLDAYAERFAAAGYHVLVFDYRHFGASEGQPRQLLSIRRQHQDWAAAVAYARSRPEVDATRIVLWGSSLSGGHVLSMAAELSAAAVIAQVPHTDGPAGVIALGPRQATRLAGHGLLDIAKAAVGAAPHYVPASGSPGSLALMTAPEAAGYLSLVPAGQAFDQRVAGRFALAIPLYSPARALRNLTMPALVQVGSRDETTPPGPAIRAAGKNPRVTCSTHETGHFEPYSGEQFEAFVTEQIDFLQHALA